MSEYNLISLVKYFDKWKKPIFILTFLAGVGSILISLTLPDYFKSTTTFYAASQDLAKPEKVLSDEDINYYGNDEDIDRIITIANSSRLVDLMIEQFNLYEHYEIEKEAPLAAYKVRKAFKRNYEVIKSKYGALEISFEDKDPDFAAAVANASLSSTDKIASNLIYNGYDQLIDLHDKTILDKSNEINSLNDSINKLRSKYGVNDIIAQNVAFSELIPFVKSQLARKSATYSSLKNNPLIPADTLAIMKAEVNGLNKELQTLYKDLEKFNMGRDDIAILERQLTDTRESLSLNKIKRQQINSGKNTKVTTTHLIEQAEPPLRKSKPKRSILVIAATFLTFLFSVIGAIIFEQYRWYKQVVSNEK